MLDGLSYTDLAGKRQPRVYAVVSGMILILLLTTGGMAVLNRAWLMRRVQAVSIPVEDRSPAESTVPATGTARQAGSPACPEDPAQWTFTPTMAGGSYQGIQPACVHRGLERTVAWALAVRQGYSRAEAARLLGFPAMPVRQLDSVPIPGEAGRLVNVPVRFSPTHPDLREWRLNGQDTAAVTYALRGCFETASVAGNRVEIRDEGYAVICLVIEDAENTRVLYALNGHMYTSTATPMRTFQLFGYTGGGEWVWLGTQNTPKMEITDAEHIARERQTMAALYESQPWDAGWLGRTHHLEMQPLPEGWQTCTEESEKQAILSVLSGAAQ